MQTITNKMKTLADFKRLPIGTNVLTIQGLPKYNGTIRKIAHKQSNAIKFEGGSWLSYPKANEFKVQDDSILIESRAKDGSIWNRLEYKIIN